jgi:hypothetical protein
MTWPRDMMTDDLAAPLFDPMLSGLSRAAGDMAATWSMAQVPRPIPLFGRPLAEWVRLIGWSRRTGDQDWYATPTILENLNQIRYWNAHRTRHMSLRSNRTFTGHMSYLG